VTQICPNEVRMLGNLFDDVDVWMECTSSLCCPQALSMLQGLSSEAIPSLLCPTHLLEACRSPPLDVREVLSVWQRREKQRVAPCPPLSHVSRPRYLFLSLASYFAFVRRNLEVRTLNALTIWVISSNAKAKRQGSH
jgi:hypothetical protein